MPIFWLHQDSLEFPPPHLANEDGIVAVGGDLSPERLIVAYENGIFPWFNPDDPIIWWSPDPRFVLFPKEIKIAKSMRSYFNQKKFEVSVDTCFEEVMRQCQEIARKGQGGGTWITESMIDGYCNLHKMGIAHSIEVWKGGELVGGLYGVALRKIFYGESMFAHVSNASKYGFILLAKKLEEWGFTMIDCQQATKHLESLGGRGIPRNEFMEYLEKNRAEENDVALWEEVGLQ